MVFIDYYKILGIDKNATEKDIKKAYRKMARKYHPDVNPNDDEAEKKFKGVNEANEVLSNPENRKKYDQHGKDWKHADEINRQRQQQSQQQQSYRQGGFNQGGEDFSDYFETMFGGAGKSSRQGQRRPQFKGQDFNATLQLNLTDVYAAQKQTLTVNNKKIRIAIPAGVEDGQNIKIKGYGGVGVQGGPKGDLLITFNVLNNTAFKRVKSTLYSTVEVDFYTAVLGGEITVNTFNGQVKLNVKPGTQNNTKVKLKGKGFPVYKNEAVFGDLYITYTIKIPAKISVEEKELFEKLSKLR